MRKKLAGFIMVMQLDIIHAIFHHMSKKKKKKKRNKEQRLVLKLENANRT